jgi:GNAT superfamily N-acetyltransferase
LDDGVTSGDIEQDAWASGRGVAPSILLRHTLEDRVSALARALGLQSDPWHDPGMALSPIPLEIPARPPELETRTIDDSGLEDWHHAAISGPSIRRFVTPAFVADPGVRLVVGYVDDRPVCRAAAWASDGVVGIYAVGTIEAARRRGFGRAAIDAGRRAWGAEAAVLQASEMGVEMYRAIGFLEVCRYVRYEALEPAG